MCCRTALAQRYTPLLSRSNPTLACMAMRWLTNSLTLRAKPQTSQSPLAMRVMLTIAGPTLSPSLSKPSSMGHSAGAPQICASPSSARSSHLTLVSATRPSMTTSGKLSRQSSIPWDAGQQLHVLDILLGHRASPLAGAKGQTRPTLDHEQCIQVQNGVHAWAACCKGLLVPPVPWQRQHWAHAGGVQPPSHEGPHH